MYLAACHAFIIGIFQLLGKSAWTRDSSVNLANGGCLALIRILLISRVAATVSVPRCDLSAIRHPLAQFLVVYLLIDFSRYWLHYAHHRVEWLWRFHRVHHSTEHLDATAGLRMHVVDFLQLSAIGVVLFGLLFDASSFSPLIWPAQVLLSDAMDAFQHCNLRPDMQAPLGRAWNQIFNSPLLHSWHHAVDPRVHNGNYGQTLMIWDRIFGTAVYREHAATEFGLDDSLQLENNPLGLQLLHPRVKN